MKRHLNGHFVLSATSVAVMTIVGSALVAQSAVAAPSDENRGKAVRIQRDNVRNSERSNVPHNPPIINRSNDRQDNQARFDNNNDRRPNNPPRFDNNDRRPNPPSYNNDRRPVQPPSYSNDRRPVSPPNYSNNDRRHFEFNQRNGRNFYGPSGNRWTRWNNSWGNPKDYARRWGFDGYDARRGWRRGNTWYAYPWLWSNWGGWSSIFLSSGSFGFSYSNGYQPYGGYGDSCMRVQTRDFYRGGRAVVSFMTCDNGWGQWTEVPGTRRFEYWTY